MAILSNLVVHGNARILNKLYVNDLQVGGSASFSALNATTITASGALSGGSLTVSGASTLNGNIAVANSKTLSLSSTVSSVIGSVATGVPLVIGTNTGQHVEFDKQKIICKSNASTSANLYINNTGGKVYLSNGEKVYAENGKIVSETGSIQTLTGTTGSFNNFNVLGTLRATKYQIDNIATLGGHFYVAPTLFFTDASGINKASVAINSKTTNTLTITINDTTTNHQILSTLVDSGMWTTESKLKISGKIGSKVFSSADAILNSINVTSGTIQTTLQNVDDTSSFTTGATIATTNVDNLGVMIYEKKQGDDYYPIGILMTGYGTNNSSYIDMYQGEATRLKPRVRIGKLDGMDASIQTQGFSPSGWGLYSDNAFLKGAIVANEGLIAGWSIYEHSIQTGTWGTTGGVLLASTPPDLAKSVGGSPSSQNNWRLTIGSNFGVTDDGTMYCSAIIANKGKIGNFNITTTGDSGNTHAYTSSLYTQKKEGDADTDPYMYEAGINAGGTKSSSIFYVFKRASATSKWTTANDANGVPQGENIFSVNNKGHMIAKDASITGTVNATAGNIGGCSIVNGELQVDSAHITSVDASVILANTIHLGGTNLLKNSYVNVTVTRTANSGTGYPLAELNLVDRDKPIAGETVTIQIKGLLASTQAKWGIYNSGGTVLMTFVEHSDYNESTEIYTKTFQWVTVKGSEVASNTYVRIYPMNKSDAGTSSIEWVMLERGNQASGWCLSPDEIGGFTIDNTSIRSASLSSIDSGSIALSTANFTRAINSISHNNLRFAIGGKFGIANDGSLYCSGADISGIVKASQGNIGGWDIDSQSIYKLTSVTNGVQSTQYGVYLNQAADSSTQVFCAGQRTHKADNTYSDWNWNTVIRADGKLVSKSGNIGGWDFESNNIHRVTGITPNVESRQYGVYLRQASQNNTMILSAGYRTHKADNTYTSWTWDTYIQTNGYFFSRAGIIAGWKINDKMFYYETDTQSGTACTQYGTYLTKALNSEDGATRLVFKSGTRSYDGTNFGNWSFKTTIRADGYFVTTSGKIGNININSNGIYSGSKSSYSSTNNGFFIGSDGTLNIQASENSKLLVNSDGISIKGKFIFDYQPDPKLVQVGSVELPLPQLVYEDSDIAEVINSLDQKLAHQINIDGLGPIYYNEIFEDESLTGYLFRMLFLNSDGNTSNNKAGFSIGNGGNYMFLGRNYQSGSADMTSPYITFNYSSNVESVGLKCNLYADTNTTGHTCFAKDSSSLYIGNKADFSSSYYTNIYLCATNIYKKTSSGQTSISDAKYKYDIHDISNYKDFIMNIQPKMFKFKDGTSNRYHTGFIAQDVEQTMNSTIGDFGIFCKVNFADEQICMLRYDEFIAPHIAVTQDHEYKIQSLEKKITELNKEIKSLKQIVKTLQN